MNDIKEKISALYDGELSLNEIDDLQHWMVQQKSKENLLKKLSQLGWKY